MAELVTKFAHIHGLDPAVHWFCDKRDDAPPQTQLGSDDRQPSKIETSLSFRLTVIHDCLPLFAYDSADVLQLKRFLSRGIDKQLGKCATCIVGYYKVKRELIEHMRGEYVEEEVELFADIFNEQDNSRIVRGLELAASSLRKLPPPERRKSALERSALLAVFEALSSEHFLRNRDLALQYLDEPFKLLQTNVRLQVTQYVPAAVSFLFDPDEDRLLWAMHTWTKYRSNLTKEDFDFAVREPLIPVLTMASGLITDMSFVQRLWCGMSLIVDKMDADLITHSLRGMEIDICRLALEHLQYDTAGLRFLLQTIRKLLTKSPKDFWDALGNISPTTFVEQVYNNPRYDLFIQGAQPEENYNLTALHDMLAWVEPFMASLHSSHQPAACRSLTFQLLERLQADRFPEFARIECFRVGLAILTTTLRNLTEDKNTADAIGRFAAAEVLTITGTYVQEVLKIIEMPRTEPKHIALSDSCELLTASALTLECKQLWMDREILESDNQLPHGYSSSSAIWNAVVESLHRGNVILARATLPSMRDLIGLERFVEKTITAHAKEKSEFNEAFEKLTYLVCQVLEQINDFDPTDLATLFETPEVADALVSALFSADANTYEAGMDLAKSITGQPARKEAFSNLLQPHFASILDSFSWSVTRIARKRTFASCPRMLKTCTDVLDILCDAQDGLLRVRPLSGMSDIRALQNFWEDQWKALRVMYEMSEDWSRRVDRAIMTDFCRDVMQFSDHFFDQYSIFAKAIDGTIVDDAVMVKREERTAVAEGSTSISGKDLLRHPSETTQAMVKFLRLKDEYLLSTSETLVTKLLRRLSEWRLCLPRATSEHLEQVLTGRVRTILRPQQKAAIARALEENLGRNVSSETETSETSRSPSVQSQHRDSKTQTAAKVKPGTIDIQAWSAKALKQREIAQLAIDEFGDAELPDDDILAASRHVEVYKQQQANALKRKASQAVAPHLLKARKTASDPKLDIQKQAAQSAFKDKREKEIQEKRKRDAEALAKVKKTVTQHKPGEGSAVGSLGTLGKDHAPRGKGMMVSSGSDTDSENELDRELFGTTAKTPKSSAAVQDYMSSKIQQKVQLPVRKTRQARNAKDMRARLAPDLSALHKTILNWDYFHNGDFPPGSNRDNYTLITSSFQTPKVYQATFEPLLILEAWQAVLKAKEEGLSKTFAIKVANRLTVDSFIEVSTTMDISEGKALGISEADIILMSKASSPSFDGSEPHCLARVFKISRKQNGMEITYRIHVGNKLVSSMSPKASLYGVKVMSITPLEREYGALQSLLYYDLCDEIVRARASPLLPYNDKHIQPIVDVYMLNTAQAKAVRSAMDNDAFTLIQGPPGSGKTKTIIAIVGALLSSSLRHTGGVSIARPQIENGNNTQQSLLPASKKLLICAPSNAAVDELVMRLKDGVKTSNGEYYKLSIVRLGRSDNMNENVKDVTLDELVNAKLNTGSENKPGTVDEVGKLMMDHKATCEQFNALMKELDGVKAKGLSQTPQQSRDFEILKRKKQQISNKIDLSRDNGHTAARDAEISRRRVQQEILDGAHVLCATLSGSGHDMFRNLNVEFETVIIDEAAQCIELSALIPLKYGCTKCIMVGDPKQLPPTVFSRDAARFQYEQSLFVRMQSNGPENVHLLDTQYRMHPEISMFPSRTFYDARLLDGPGMAALRTRPWHKSQLLSPYRFFDVQGTQQNAPSGHSLINVAEIEVAICLFDRLTADYKGYNFAGNVGIITPYKSQLAELRSRFTRKYGNGISRIIEFNTADAFQGRECEIIIFSCVRASAGRGIGFLADIRRMNVGITRAKSSLWVLGNSQSLRYGEFWANLIDDAKSRNRYTQGNLLEMLQKPNIVAGTDWQDFRSTDRDLEIRNAPIRSDPTTVDYPSGRSPARASIDVVMTDAPDDELSSGANDTALDTSVPIHRSSKNMHKKKPTDPFIRPKPPRVRK
ncbi:DEAD-box type RNA helicase [Lambiella insularis]|nr:DEAD-box type RNA helicase [Lambiella insularis]